MINKIDFEKRKHLLIFIEKVDDDFSPSLSSRINLNTYVDKLLSQADIYAYIIAGEIKGVVAYYANDPDLIDAYISFIAVDKMYRNAGIGNTLMRWVINDLKTKGFTYIKLTARKSSPSVDFYKRFGFLAMNEFSYSNSDVDGLVMALKI